MRTEGGIHEPMGWGRAAVLLLAAAMGTACAPGAMVATHAWEHVRATAARGAPLHRWPPGTELVVDVSGLAPEDGTAVLRAFDAWLEAPAPLRVRAAEPGGEADVVFRQVPEIREGYEGMGLTRLEWEGRWLVRAEVELALASRCGPPLTAAERRRTLLHEVGHVLGLAHSPRLYSIMHRDAPGSDVDAADRAALRLLYAVRPVTVVAATPASP